MFSQTKDGYHDLVESVEAILTEESVVKKIVDPVFKKLDRNPTIGETYLLKAPNGKPLFYTVSGVRGNESHGRWGILEFGRIFSNHDDKQWYIQTMSFSDKEGARLVVSPEFASKVLKSVGISVNKMPEVEKYHKYDDFDYEVLK